MTVAYRAIGTAVGTPSAATISVAPPAGTTLGDILLMAIWSNSTSTKASPPGDWTLVDEERTLTNNVSVYYKIAGASESNYTVSRTGSEGYAAVVVGFYSDAALTMAVNAHANRANASSGNRTYPGVTTTKTSAGLACFGSIAPNFSSSPPGDMTERLDALTSISRTYVMTSILVASGATGDKVATGVAAESSCVTVAVAELVLPATPTDLTVTPVSATQLDITWTDTANETGYKLERSNDGSTGWAEIATPAANATSHSDTTLSEHVTRYYRIRGTNADGDGPYSSVANGTTLIIPPSNLVATANGSDQIDLTWDDNSGVEDGYEIEKSADGVSGWSLIHTTAAGVESYSDTSLTPEETAYYRVRAIDGADESTYTSVASATTDALTEIDVTLAGSLAELEAETQTQVTLLGVLAEIGNDTSNVTLFGVLMEMEYIKPMPVYFPLPVEWNHNHIMLPEPLTGYQLDAGGSYWSVVVPSPAKNLMKAPSFEYVFGVSNLFIVNFSPGDVSYNKASRGFGSLLLTPIAGIQGTVTYFFKPENVGYWNWSFDLYHTAGQEFTIGVYDEDVSGVFATATINARFTGWGRYRIFYYEKDGPPVTRAVRLAFTAANTNLSPVYTDGWLITEAKDEEVSYFDGDMQDESFAADPYAYGWMGDPHFSISVRSGRNFAGGKIRSFYDLGFMTTAIMGLGMGDPVPDILLLSDGRDVLRGNRIEEREFSIIGKLVGCDPYQFTQKRNQLISFLNTLNSSSGSLMLMYQAVNGTGYPLGKRLWMHVAFIGGMGGQIDNHYQENVELRFRLLGLKLVEEFGENKILNLGAAPDGESLIYSRDPRTGEWETYTTEDTLGGSVLTVLVLNDGRIMVGGEFTTIGGVSADHVAMYDPNTGTWAQVGTGLNDRVVKLAVGKGIYDGDVIAIGNFTLDGDEVDTIRKIARWDGDNWLEVGGGLDVEPDDLLIYPDGRIFVAGLFTETVATSDPLHGFAYWDARPTGDADWHDLLSAVDGVVRNMALSPDLKIYISGSFASINGDTDFNAVARFDPQYEAFPLLAYNNLAKGLNANVRDITVAPDGYLYAVGDFSTTVAGATARNFARFNGVNWEEVGNGEIDVDSMYQIVVDKRGNAYIATDPFNDGPEGFAWTSSYFGWNGSTWFPLDIRSVPVLADPTGHMVITPDGRLFVPVNFNSLTSLAGYTAVNYTGTADAPIRLQITGPVSVIRLSNWTTNQHIYFEPFELQAGEKLTLDLTGVEARAFTSLRPDVLSQILAGASDLLNFHLVPGVNHITLTTVGETTEDTKAVLAWNNHHWSIDQGLADL